MPFFPSGDLRSVGFAVKSNVITRPADTTVYAVGDLVANSTTAGSVTPFSLATVVNPINTFYTNSGRIDRCRIRKTGVSVANASFRVHFYSAAPTVSNGDNGAWLSSITDYVGACDVTVDRVFTNGSEGTGLPLSGSGIVFSLPSGSTLYALVEARGAYTPVSAEQFTVIVEGYRL